MGRAANSQTLLTRFHDTHPFSHAEKNQKNLW